MVGVPGVAVVVACVVIVVVCEGDRQCEVDNDVGAVIYGYDVTVHAVAVRMWWC